VSACFLSFRFLVSPFSFLVRSTLRFLPKQKVFERPFVSHPKRSLAPPIITFHTVMRNIFLRPTSLFSSPMGGQQPVSFPMLVPPFLFRLPPRRFNILSKICLPIIWKASDGLSPPPKPPPHDSPQKTYCLSLQISFAPLSCLSPFHSRSAPLPILPIAFLVQPNIFYPRPRSFCPPTCPGSRSGQRVFLVPSSGSATPDGSTCSDGFFSSGPGSQPPPP